jgi:hypothetical protein
MAAQVGAANTGQAFIGGAQARNLAPPNAITGTGIPSANTSVGAPVGGVNPSQMKQARNNEGSNIGIPYTRCARRRAAPAPAQRPRPRPRPRPPRVSRVAFAARQARAAAEPQRARVLQH